MSDSSTACQTDDRHTRAAWNQGSRKGLWFPYHVAGDFLGSPHRCVAAQGWKESRKRFIGKVTCDREAKSRMQLAGCGGGTEDFAKT